MLVTSVVAPGKALSTAAMPVSVRKGQRRKGLRITPKRTKRAKRTFVQENGPSPPGCPHSPWRTSRAAPATGSR